MDDITVEALAASAEDCVAAERCGADRVELNSSLGAGGLTPSVGAVAVAHSLVSIPIIAMLRPRPAGFCYHGSEFDTLLRDAEALASAGCDGFAFGILTEAGEVDVPRCRRLMAAIDQRLEWVFHRAFDLTPDPAEALEKLIDMGVRRVLTKGQANSYEEGEPLLLRLREQSAGRIELLVPGVRPHNINRIVAECGFDQIHLGRFVDGLDPSNSARPDIFFGVDSAGKEGCFPVLDEEYLSSMVHAARGA